MVEKSAEVGRSPLRGSGHSAQPEPVPVSAAVAASVPNAVETGWLKGHPIRTARKAGKCAEFRHCGNMIQVGDRYVEGDTDPYSAGGFAHERLCLLCADVSA